MSAKIAYEKEVTEEDIVSEANAIWKQFLTQFPEKTGERDQIAAFYKEMRETHPQLAQSYPIVLRYMCELGQYSTKALRKYLKRLRHNPWNSVDSYLESQASYLLILYKALTPHYRENEAKRYYANCLAMLKEERRQFEKETAQAQETVDKNHERIITRNRMELRDYFATFGHEAVDVPITVISDVAAAVASEAISAVAIPDGF